jgi:peptidoglycan/xylan/chitin deacetylase (PgdA/CDA1 family)
MPDYHGSVILTYHSVNHPSQPFIYPDNIVSVENFRAQMAYLSSQRTILSLEELVWCLKDEQEPPSDSVVITFDDAYHDFYLNAYPILRELGASCTLFLITGLLGDGTPKWDDWIAQLVNETEARSLNIRLGDREITYPLGSAVNKRRCIVELVRTFHGLTEVELLPAIARVEDALRHGRDMTSQRVSLRWSEVLNISKETQLVSFGAHTRTHPNLLDVCVERADEEIASSKREIEQALGRQCSFFSYPYGVFDERIKELVRRHGFLAATTTIPGSISPGTDPFELRRVCAPNQALDDFISLLAKFDRGSY